MLFVGASLLIRTFVALSEVKPGFNPKGVLTLQTSLAGLPARRAMRIDPVNALKQD